MEDEQEYIPTMNTAEATEWLRARGLRLSPETVRLGILQGAFPFGDCITSDKAPRCIIYTRLLEEWAAARYAKPDPT